MSCWLGRMDESQDDVLYVHVTDLAENRAHQTWLYYPQAGYYCLVVIVTRRFVQSCLVVMLHSAGYSPGTG